MIKSQKIKEYQWDQEKAILSQRIEQLSNENFLLQSKCESHKKAFRNLLEVYSDIRSTNRCSLINCQKTEWNSNESSENKFSEVFKRLDVALLDGHLRDREHSQCRLGQLSEWEVPLRKQLRQRIAAIFTKQVPKNQDCQKLRCLVFRRHLE